MFVLLMMMKKKKKKVVLLTFFIWICCGCYRMYACMCVFACLRAWEEIKNNINKFFKKIIQKKCFVFCCVLLFWKWIWISDDKKRREMYILNGCVCILLLILLLLFTLKLIKNRNAFLLFFLFFKNNKLSGIYLFIEWIYFRKERKKRKKERKRKKNVYLFFIYDWGYTVYECLRRRGKCIDK